MQIASETKNIVYITCPSCSYRHGPMGIDDGKEIVGCPKENTKEKVHRYTLDEMEKVRMQLLSQMNKVNY